MSRRFRSKLKALDPQPGHVALFSERADTILLMRLDDGYPSPRAATAAGRTSRGPASWRRPSSAAARRSGCRSE